MSRYCDIAWAAGLFEGEGCFTSGGSGGAAMRATVTSTDRDVLERFARIVGFGTILEKRLGSTKWKPCGTWSAGGDDAVALYELLLPHLGQRRRQRGGELASRRKAWIAAATAPRVCPECGTKFTPEFGRRKSAHARVYCSKPCRKVSLATRSREQYLRRVAKQKATLALEHRQVELA